METIPTELRHERLQSVRARLADWSVDGLLLGSPVNRRWLSGFSGSSGYLLLSADRALIVTDSRYWERARQEAPAFELWPQKADRQADLLAAVAALDVSRLGLEAQHTTLATWRQLEKVPAITWTPLDQTVEPQRAVKADPELRLIRRAAALADQAMASVPELARPGRTEAEVAWVLEQKLRNDGAEGVAFDTIVAGGPNAALPHHPGQRPLQPGDAIVVDLGARVAGYHSDLTRTFYLGAEPDDRFRQVYELVARAEAAALAGTRPGMSGPEADALARDLIVAAGYGEQFGHGLGHGVGLEIHEEPRLSRLAGEDPLRPGMVVTIEPGVYLPGWGGVRLEDLALLTESGLEILSQSPYEPAIPA